MPRWTMEFASANASPLGILSHAAVKHENVTPGHPRAIALTRQIAPIMSPPRPRPLLLQLLLVLGAVALALADAALPSYHYGVPIRVDA